jgi:DNA polymerase-3 subunit alpha
MEFVSFHTHTTTSYGDGFGTMPQHVSRVAELGMTALAVSEHGNVSSHAALEKECRKAKIKPIFGIEAYFSPTGVRKTQRKTHLGLYAMNEEGYRNLNRIVTQSYRDFYQFPTVSWESLVKNNAGIAVLSGCADSFISCSLLGGKFLGDKRDSFTDKDLATTRARVMRFADTFDGRFYLEVQRFPGLDRTCKLNPVFAQISGDTGIPLIATADVHYPYPNQNEMQRALHAAHRGGTAATADADFEHNIILSYPLTDKEIFDDLIGTGLTKDQAAQAISSTTRLAEICTVELPKAKPLRFPGVKYQENLVNHERSEHRQAMVKRYMWERLREGWIYRCNQHPELGSKAKEYNARLQHEMKVIGDKDFYDYFLMVSDLVSRAKNRGTAIGPARGSAASSLVCYLLRITEIDPLHPVFNRMIFERFIDPTRTDYPDIDLDFDDDRRLETVSDAIAIYGPDCVAAVGNHVKYRGKKALNAMAKAYALPLKTFKPIGDRITDRVETDDRVDDTITDVVLTYGENPEISKLLVQHNDPIRLAAELEGNEFTLGVHAAGFVVSDKTSPISDVCALYTREQGTGRSKKKTTVIPYDKRDAEYLGMLKADFLGLTTMGMIGRCLELTGLTVEDLYRIPFDAKTDPVLFASMMERFANDDVTGIFQFEGITTRNILKRVNPTEFRHLADVNALSRPGPKYGGQTENYIAVKNGEKDWERIHETGFDRHVEWTYGQIVYQEQIMWILRDLAGFDVPTVLKVRKIIGKKLGEHQFAALWEQFRDGCAAIGVDEDAALRVWGAITTAAGYAFNTSHAYSYSVIAWWSMWLKIHYPIEFFCASLAKNGDGKDDLPRRTALLQDALAHDMKIGKLYLGISKANWSVYRQTIYPGYQQVPGIGELTAKDIYKSVQETAVMGNWDDLRRVKGVGPKTIEGIVAFANKRDPLGISHTEDQLAEFRRQLMDGEFNGTGLPEIPETYCPSDDLPTESNNVAWVGFASNIDYRDELEIQHRKTGESYAEIRERITDSHMTKKAVIFAYDEIGEVALRVGRKDYERLEPILNKIKPDHHLVVAFGRTWRVLDGSILVNSLWILEPE